MQYFVEAPSEERSVKRGDRLEFFGFADSANLFAGLTNTAGGLRLESIPVRLPMGKTRSEVAPYAEEAVVA